MPAAVDATDREADLLSGWRLRALVASVVLAAAGYLAFALWSGWHEVAHATAQVGLDGMALVLLLSLLNYVLRFVRWQLYLDAMGTPVPHRPSWRIYLAGFALTTTPGKAGEALRGVLLRRWSVPYATSLAAFFSERLSDLLAVVLLTLFGLSAYPTGRPLIAVGAVAVLGLLGVLAHPQWLARGEQALSESGRLSALLRHLLRIGLQARRCHRPALLLGASVLSLLAWSAEAWSLHLILGWMGLDVGLTDAVFAYALSMLAGALSFLPGGLGGAEGTMVALLITHGAGQAQAVAATVLIRLATLWFAVLIGVLALAITTSIGRTRGPARQPASSSPCAAGTRTTVTVQSACATTSDETLPR